MRSIFTIIFLTLSVFSFAQQDTTDDSWNGIGEFVYTGATANIGAGLFVSADARFDGNFDLLGYANIGGKLTVNDTTRLNGNVGIGTSPLAKLHLYGDAFVIERDLDLVGLNVSGPGVRYFYYSNLRR